MLERVKREIKEHDAREQGLLRFPYLNNFHLHLPGGLYRRVHEELGMDAPYDDARASRKLRSMTPRQFYRLVDSAIDELGLDRSRLSELLAARDPALHEYIFPLYVSLRAQGFRHYPDLTA